MTIEKKVIKIPIPPGTAYLILEMFSGGGGGGDQEGLGCGGGGGEGPAGPSKEIVAGGGSTPFDGQLLIPPSDDGNHRGKMRHITDKS